MTLFFDTAALVKFFSEEAGSERVTRWILENPGRLWLFELAALEFHSALYRKLRNREISSTAFAVATQGFQNELARFQVEPASRATMRQAQIVLEGYGQSKALRTLDAMHFAAFVLIAEDDWHFVTAMGHKTLNPLDIG